MAGIIKKQILKHLSRFAKNLSPDKINLSTLKGEGQLSNLELDEEVLQNMLDLPTWLAVTRVYCNKAAIRIQWTKLKTSPICLLLDKVEVEMRTCEEPRPPNGPSPIAITAGQSEYGFAEKVVEGMSVLINSITIKVQAQAFHASFELWQLQGNSLNPKWQRSDLRYTRITDPLRGEVLTFKEINWQTLRIEADAMESGEQDLGSTPLRLITNQGRIRIALKRRVKDCNVVASKLLFILDDLLWVLTDSQLKAMIRYAKSLSEAIERSAQQRKSMAPDPLQRVPTSPGAPPPWNEPAPHAAPPSGVPNSLSQYFEQHDVKESSYHTLISRLDLHICDDSSDSEAGGQQPRVAGGAIQLTFHKLGFDYYPFHWPSDGCRHWERYCGAMETRAQWVSKLLQDFQRQAEGQDRQTGSPVQGKGTPTRTQDGGSTPKSSPPDRAQTPRRTSAALPPHGLPWKRLRSSCLLIRVDDLDIYQVSSKGRHSKKPQTLVSCNRKSLQLPDNVSAIHIQFTEYYFPDHSHLPVPCSNLYGQLNGLQLTPDPLSLLWINLFSLGLLHSLEQVKAFYKLEDSGKGEEHVDVRMDICQLKLVIPLESRILDHPDRPQRLCVQASQSVFTNTRHCAHATAADLQGICHSFSHCPFFQLARGTPSFPRTSSSFPPLPSAFLQHALEGDGAPEPLSKKKPPRSQDVWSLHLSGLALDFEGARRSPRGKALPFVEPLAISLWICRPGAFHIKPHLPHFPPGCGSRLRASASCSNHIDSGLMTDRPGKHLKSRTVQDLLDLGSNENDWPAQNGAGQDEDAGQMEMASIHVLAQALSPIRLRLNHYQYVALLRMKDTFSRLGAELAQDTLGLRGEKVEPPTVSVGLLLESAEVVLLLPPATLEDTSPGSTESPSLTDSELSPAKGPLVAARLEDSGIGKAGSSEKEDGDGATAPPPVEEACEAVEALEDAGPSSPSPSLNPPLHSRDNSSFSLEGELSSALTATKDVTKEAMTVTMDLTKEAVSITKDAFSILSREKMASTMHKMLFVPPAREQPSRLEEAPSAPGRLRFLNTKLSQSQLSLDSTSLDASLPDDRFSIDSDSSDNFVILMDSESGSESLRPDSTPFLRADHGSRDSPALGTERDSSPDLSSSLSQSMEELCQDQVSVLLLRLSDVGCAVDMKGDDLLVALEARDVVPEQLGNVTMQQLLSGHALGVLWPRRTPSSEPQETVMGAPVVQLQFVIGPAAAAQHGPLAETNGFLHLRVRGCTAELLTSSLASLGPFLEDELSADLLPMRVELDSTTVTLKDDGPLLYPTSPRPVPVIFSVDGLALERADDGIFYLRAAGKESQEQASNTAASLNPDISTPDQLQRALDEAQAALETANADRERLLQEIRKYNPGFDL
ncbi:UHRF1-binding protein 1-like [Polyodon spathula]|uniref:UHRF1-binding protein 1-like n=1 Tax=Polyodon spathula TaxID=7913 RepID=UPI001B7E2FC9|nr:UHRF1-binding protein 1-like [Polyodon spathula]